MHKEYFGCVINVKNIDIVNCVAKVVCGIEIYGIKVTFVNGIHEIFDHYTDKADRDVDYNEFVNEEVI